jgi:hypothetical protein
MSKFEGQATVQGARHPVQTTKVPARTATGGYGVVKEPRSDLFLLTLNNFVSEKQFHEDELTRDDRFVNLLHQATKEDPEWMQRFIPYVRHTIGMRSAPVVMAVEYGVAGGPNRRSVVASALERGDEPAEAVAYWLLKHASNPRQWRNHNAPHDMPMWLKRGIADAAVNIYNEYTVLKYDGEDRNVRMADVLSLTHPQGKTPWQNDLFKYVLNRRYGVNEFNGETLPMIRNNIALRGWPVELRREWLVNEIRTDSVAEQLRKAGFNWEDLSGWLQGPMDAKAWEAIIPSMGYFALVRNLRNFEQAGISAQAQALVEKRLTDPEAARKSKLFPIRFLSAYEAVNSDRWRYPLSVALDNVLVNVPSLPGRTLILVDCSGSMNHGMSGKTQLTWSRVAGLFGSALALRAEDATLVRYGADSEEVAVPKGGSVLRLAEQFAANQGSTYTFAAMNKHYAGHDRIVVLTDGQAHDAGIPVPDARMYTFDLAGYNVAHIPTGPKSFAFGGLTDHGFVALAELEKFHTVGWPF